MEIIGYVSTSDGFTHYIINNALGVPFELWILLVGGCLVLLSLILKKIIG